MNRIPRIDTYFLRPIPILCSHLQLDQPKRLFPVGVPVKNSKSADTAFHSGYMACPSQSSRLDQNGRNYEDPHCGVFSTPQLHPSWTQIFPS